LQYIKVRLDLQKLLVISGYCFDGVTHRCCQVISQDSYGKSYHYFHVAAKARIEPDQGQGERPDE